MSAPGRIAISLLSHTNAGKTTLMRTLLGRDIGQVRDAAHVTEFAEGHVLIAVDGHELMLWDTPGFGDSQRLAKRLEGADQPLLGFLRDTWDRIAQRPFWCSQQAIKNAREEADALLYLVNASESPQTAGYLDAELRILGWIGKPVIVALNQMGAPRAAAEEAAEVARWRDALARQPLVRAVLPLDAFARCWVQESVLWRAFETALDPQPRRAMNALHRAWRHEREQVFDNSLRTLADFLIAAAADREPIDDPGLAGRLREWVRSTVSGGVGDAESRARERLAARLDAAASEALGKLVALHALEGSAVTEIAADVAQLQTISAPMSETRAGLLGGALGGAALGLKADLATGGLSFGAGMLVGGVLGALSAAGIARGVNHIRGTEAPVVTWSNEAMARLTADALLRYLAVAHFGRGRGPWREVGAPAHWAAAVDAALTAHGATDSDAWTDPYFPSRLRACALDTLQRLYPEAARYLPGR
jgi:hypothetical protein